MIAKLSEICFPCLHVAQISSSSSHSPLKIIIKQLFTSGSVNIAEYLLPLWRIIVKYKCIKRRCWQNRYFRTRYELKDFACLLERFSLVV